MHTLARARARLISTAPLLLLLATAGSAAALYLGAGGRGHLVGFAQTIPEAVAPPELARVSSIEVVVGQQVAAGQVLARLDVGDLDAEIAIVAAERGKLEADVRAELGFLERHLDTDLEALQRQLAAERKSAVSASAEAAALDREIERVRRLVEGRQAVVGDLTALGLKQASTAALAGEEPRTLGLLSKQVEAAQERRARMTEPTGVLASTLQADLAVMDRKLERLEQRKERFVLRATQAGRVTEIDKRAGEMAGPTEPIVRLVTRSERVVACVPERLAPNVKLGDGARLWPRGQRGAALRGKTIALSPAIGELPVRCWRDPKIPQVGREITIALEAPAELLAGQAYDVSLVVGSGDGIERAPAPNAPDAPLIAGSASGSRLAIGAANVGGAGGVFAPATARAASVTTALPPIPTYVAAPRASTFAPAAFETPPSKAPSSAPSTSALSPASPASLAGPGAQTALLALSSRAASAGPRPLTLPATLLAKTRFEPSGLIARAAEGRYLVVSDDTGRDATEGAPWLFAMSPSGLVDPEPVVVEGLRAVDDLEGIAQGSAGEIFLLSSQSYSKKGNRKPARTALLRLHVSGASGASLHVDGEIHLAELLDEAPTRAKALGLDQGTRALDLEGLTFHDGALFVGVKAPLDADGNALIWRIERPAALFDGASSAPDRLGAAGASVYARVKVDVELAGVTTPGGISELLFLPDGALAIASTPSTAAGSAGALFRVDDPRGGTLRTRLLRRFAGRQPEGLSVSLAHPDALMVVFDAGASTPTFEEVPWKP